MNTESIIGLIASVFGIVTGCAWLYNVLRNPAKTKSSKELFKELVNKSLSDAEKRKVLVKLNKKSIIKGKIKDEYINSFKWAGRSMGKVLLDICEKNDIELTDDVSLGLVGERWVTVQKEYQENKKKRHHLNADTFMPKSTVTNDNFIK